MSPSTDRLGDLIEFTNLAVRCTLLAYLKCKYNTESRTKPVNKLCEEVIDNITALSTSQ